MCNMFLRFKKINLKMRWRCQTTHQALVVWTWKNHPQHLRPRLLLHLSENENAELLSQLKLSQRLSEEALNVMPIPAKSGVDWVTLNECHWFLMNYSDLYTILCIDGLRAW